VIAGEDARILHLAEDGHDTSFDVRQAFLQYATGNLTVMAGKFVTLAGAEVINPTLNTNFSRSLLFFDSEPLTHTGVRAAYAMGEFTFIGGVNNGWNSTSTSYGSKTGELSVAYAAGYRVNRCRGPQITANAVEIQLLKIRFSHGHRVATGGGSASAWPANSRACSTRTPISASVVGIPIRLRSSNTHFNTASKPGFGNPR